MFRLALTVIVLLFASSASAQTGACPTGNALVLNPTYVCFTASSDHDAVEFGVPKLDHYAYSVFLEGVNPDTGTPIQASTSLGKPTPNAQGAIWIQRSDLGALPVATRMLTYVDTFGSNGAHVRSLASNPFGRTSQAAPAAAGRPSMTQGQ